jgi:hypothetical protein
MHPLILYFCISYRSDYSRWRWLSADRGPSRGNSYRSWNQKKVVLKTSRTSSRNSRKARIKVRTLLTWLTPAPPVKASPGHNLLFYYTAIYIYLCILCIKFLGIAWNPRCINPRNQCIALEVISTRCSANRAGRSRVISCHSRDIGVVMITFLLSL